VLDWFADERDEARGSGRTMVLALSFLKQMVLEKHLGKEDWIYPYDHYSFQRSRTNLRSMIHLIFSLAEQSGIDVRYIDHNYGEGHNYTKDTLSMRINLHYQLPHSAVDAFREFGRLENELREGQKKQQTLWDYIKESAVIPDAD
jgi:hypothetical protein